METLGEPHIGFAMLPKRTVNVKTCELLRFARITPDFVHIVSVGATRARPDLFQDDLYPPCLSGLPSASIQDYTSGGTLPELPRQSMQPEGMPVCALFVFYGLNSCSSLARVVGQILGFVHVRDCV